MRPDIAASLQTIQSQLGDDLGGVLDEEPTALSIPQFRQSLDLEHVGGLHAGGAFKVDVGSYRFGRATGSTMFDVGTPQQPQFGLTVDPDGVVMLFPPMAGLKVDGTEVVDPQPINIGQIIGVGHDRFRLRPTERLSVARRGGGGRDTTPAMPAPSKGRSVDQPILDWAFDIRDREVRSHWAGLVGPVQVHRQIDRGELFGSAPGSPSFGHALIGTTDRPFAPPAQVADANRATREAVESLVTTVPGVPVTVDLAKGSLAIIGPRAICRSVASWLALSLLAQTSPQHLGLEPQAEVDAVEWSWLNHLPHVETAASAELVLTLINKRRPQVPPTGGIVLLGSSDAAPEGVMSVLRLTADTATFTDLAAGTEEIEVSPIGIANAVAVERSLAMSQHLNSEGVS